MDKEAPTFDLLPSRYFIFYTEKKNRFTYTIIICIMNTQNFFIDLLVDEKTITK